MAEINLSQAEADALIAMEKHRVTDERVLFPACGQSVTTPLQSADKREQFLLDLSRGRIDLMRCKYQTRARQIVVLVRLDLAGQLHRNPDGTEVGCPHLHLYREGYGHKWATPVPLNQFQHLGDVWATLQDFMQYCNITRPPFIEQDLFT